MSIPYYIEHGKTSILKFPNVEISKRQRSIDSMRCSVRTNSEDTYREGGALPEYPHMRLKEVVSRQDGPGWIHDLTAEGLRRGPDKLESSMLRQPEEGWDEGPMTWLTVQPDLWKIKNVHPVVDTLWISDIEKEDINGHVWRIKADCKGIIPVDGLPKGYKRRYSVATSSVPTSAPIQLYIRQPDGSYVLDPNSRDYIFSSPSVQVTDTFLSFTEPDTAGIPGNWIPPDPPPTRNLLTDLTLGDPGVLTAAAIAAQAINIPNGWVLESIASERLFDLDVWLTSYTGRFVRDWDIKL